MLTGNSRHMSVRNLWRYNNANSIAPCVHEHFFGRNIAVPFAETVSGNRVFVFGIHAKNKFLCAIAPSLLMVFPPSIGFSMHDHELFQNLLYNFNCNFSSMHDFLLNAS